MWNNQKQQNNVLPYVKLRNLLDNKKCFALCQTYKPTIILN